MWNVCVCVWKTRVFYVSFLVGLNLRTYLEHETQGAWNDSFVQPCVFMNVIRGHSSQFFRNFPSQRRRNRHRSTQNDDEWKFATKKHVCLTNFRATPNVYSITYITPWKVLMLRLFVYSNYSGENSCAPSLRSDPSFVKLSQTLKPLWIASWQLTYLLWKALLKILFPLCDILVFWGVYVGWVMLKDQLKLVAL